MPCTALYAKAKAEMAGLSRIVENEIEARPIFLLSVACVKTRDLVHKAQITSYMANMQHLSKSAAFAKKAASFLRARQPVAASGAQLTTNVRVMASDEPFPTIAGMVEDLVYILQRAIVARFKPNFLCDPGASAVHAKTQHTYIGPFVHLLLFRDAGESVVRAKILEWELQLLQAENKIISDRLESWVAQIAR